VRPRRPYPRRVGGNLITERELNRALLARQGLLERLSGSLDAAMASIGALQMQYWPALGPALWARVADLDAGAPHQAHATQELVTGTLLRGTIHTVAAADYPAYAVVTGASKLTSWQRNKDEPGPEIADLEQEILDHAAEPRTADELTELTERWVERHPGVLSDAELEYQRTNRWRPWRSTVWLVRAPGDGVWGPRTPTSFRRAPTSERPSVDEALTTVIRRHLQAFGPAAAEDVASWIHWKLTPVRRALQHLEETGDLVTMVDEANRVLYDLAVAPRPGADVEAPVRLLPWFDSALLAYAPKHRTRILPDDHSDVVWARANGQLRPTFLVDGMVAGMWSIASARGTATLTLTPLRPLGATTRRALVAEAEGTVRFCQPDAKAYDVRL
jgi:Winged helix DNA-binding domain